ncbi:type II toxin-antitoxin system ParD family antitoxin [Sphingobium aromaticiconvertens]|uniref:type II toxin-antitoxin system ParD family antitoxin n=1 Tax=Sphingobium aromaticiconvertens TaxID=365341 RepID=UPI003018C3B8
MATMNVSLPDPMRDYVQNRIDSGQYASVSDYVRDLIRRDQTETEVEQGWLRELDASIERGLEDERADRLYDLGEVCAEVRAEIEGMAGEQSLQ